MRIWLTFLVKFSGQTNEQYVCDGEQTQLPHGNLSQFSTGKRLCKSYVDMMFKRIGLLLFLRFLKTDPGIGKLPQLVIAGVVVVVGG